MHATCSYVDMCACMHHKNSTIATKRQSHNTCRDESKVLVRKIQSQSFALVRLSLILSPSLAES